MSFDPLFMYIGYDIASWVHPDWLEHLEVRADLSSSLKNRLLFERADLQAPSEQDCDRWPDDLATHWRKIEALSYLCGARLTRARLLADGALDKLSFNAKDFLSIPAAVLEAHISPRMQAEDLPVLEPAIDPFSPAPTRHPPEGWVIQVQSAGWKCLECAFRDAPPSLMARAALALPPAASLTLRASLPKSLSWACQCLFTHAVNFSHAHRT